MTLKNVSHKSVALCAFLLALAVLQAWVMLRPIKIARPVTGSVTLGDLQQTVLGTGKLRPKELVSVGAQVSGQVKRLYVSLGQAVHAGDRIADIDAAPQRLALESAEAGVKALQSQRAARLAALAQAELAFRRQATMLAADASSRADYETASATLQTTRNEVKALDAQIVQSRTQVETARTNLGYTRIVAPMDGTVVAVVTKQGQTVNSFQSAPTIVMLARLDIMTVRAEISEADIEKVRPGQVTWFTTLGAGDRRHIARIQKIEPAPESIATEGTTSQTSSGTQSSNTAVYYIAQFDVPNPDRLLRPSMTAQVSILLNSAHRAVLVPSAALSDRTSDGRARVRVVDAQGRISTRRIETGISDEARMVVLAGLRPGETVVLSDAPSADNTSGGGLGF